MDYMKRMREIQDQILEFLDDIESDQQKFDRLSTLLISIKTKNDKYELKSLLYLISKITKNHFRCPAFFDRIKKIINIFQEEIKQTFSNVEIFDIFTNNKLLLLLLIENEIITLDQDIISKISEKEDYITFLYPEISKVQPDIKPRNIPEHFDEKRRYGENDSYCCELIRNDNAVEFIVLYNKNEINLEMKVPYSIYETNPFLLKKEATLIEYSAFFGSVDIFNFLRMNCIRINSSLWLYAIHGKNADIIHCLEENKVEIENNDFQILLKESIKCHNNDLANYFKDNFVKEIDIHSNYFKNEFSYAFNFYNFKFIPDQLDEPFFFFYAIEYDYFNLVNYYLKNIKNLDINRTIILSKS